MLHNGWWLAAGVYLVADAGLPTSQLLLVGVAQGTVALLFEVPAGVIADTMSRKWSLVFSSVLMGAAMLATGMVTLFPALMATQMLWGLSWTFASGADVAWVTDELDEPSAIAGLLTRAARAQLTGSAAGIVGVGVLAASTSRSLAMVLAGSAMLLLSSYIALRFPERNFRPVRTGRWSASLSILRRGLRLSRRSPLILVVFLATLLSNGAADAFVRLYPQQLFATGLSGAADTMLLFTALAVGTLLVGAAALRLAEASLSDVGMAPRSYVLACGAGALGLGILAVASDAVTGAAAVLVVGGIALPLTRTIATILVNGETTGDVRATVHSLLAQAEYLGEVACGLTLVLLARSAGSSSALLGCAVLLAAATACMTGARSGRTRTRL